MGIHSLQIVKNNTQQRVIVLFTRGLTVHYQLFPTALVSVYGVLTFLNK